MQTTIFAASLFLISFSAFARLTPDNDPNSIKPATPAELHNLASTSGCSAGYVDIGRAKNERAVILTNGHCVSSSLVARQAMINIPSTKTFSIFLESGAGLAVTATRLLYATLMDTDIALFELKESNAELEAKGLEAFPFYTAQAPLGNAVRVTSGYWKETQECLLERRVHKLLEGFGTDISNPSVATAAIALSKDCKIRGGYSGTPVVDVNTNSIIAIAFTGAEGSSACAEQSPCEEDASGNRVYRKGTSYVARVDQLGDCIVGGEFNMALPSCTLFRK